VHYLYRGIDEHGQVLDCWLSRTRDLAAAAAFFRHSINSTGCTLQLVVTIKPRSIRRRSAPPRLRRRTKHIGAVVNQLGRTL
jgi:transposase-like protein